MKFGQVVLALPLVFAFACGGAQTSHAPPSFDEGDLDELDEDRALTLVAETLLDAGYRVSSDWSVDVGWDAPLAVDLRAEGADFGVEWVSLQDHADHGERVPAPAPEGQLRILSGRGESAGAHVLLLDTVSYRFHADPDAVHAGEAGARDVESRLRRDVRDFLEFERGRAAR